MHKPELDCKNQAMFVKKLELPVRGAIEESTLCSINFSSRYPNDRGGITRKETNKECPPQIS